MVRTSLILPFLAVAFGSSAVLARPFSQARAEDLVTRTLDARFADQEYLNLERRTVRSDKIRALSTAVRNLRQALSKSRRPANRQRLGQLTAEMNKLMSVVQKKPRIGRTKRSLHELERRNEQDDQNIASLIDSVHGNLGGLYLVFAALGADPNSGLTEAERKAILDTNKEFDQIREDQARKDQEAASGGSSSKSGPHA